MINKRDISKLNEIWTKFFIIVLLTLAAVLLLMTFIPILVHMAFAQQAGTPTTPNALPSSTPNLQFQPQKAIIYVEPTTGQFQAIPIQQSSSIGIGAGEATGIGGILTAVGMGIWAKISGKKELEKEIIPVKETLKDNTVAIVQSKEVEHSIAKQVYDFAPEDKLKAMEGTAPETKLSKLQENKDKAVETAAKAPT